MKEDIKKLKSKKQQLVFNLNEIDIIFDCFSFGLVILEF